MEEQPPEKTTNAELVHSLDQQDVIRILICTYSGCITAFCSGTPACSSAQHRLTDTHTHPYTGPQSKKIFQGEKWGMKQSEQALAIRKAGLSEQLTHLTEHVLGLGDCAVISHRFLRSMSPDEIQGALLVFHPITLKNSQVHYLQKQNLLLCCVIFGWVK